MIRIRRNLPHGILIDQESRRGTIPRPFNASLPDMAIIPLLQHNGNNALAVVKIGSKVEEGAVLGEAVSGSVMVHSSVPGTVVGTRTIRYPDGRGTEALEVELEGSFASLGSSFMETADLPAPEPDTILGLIEKAGLIHDHHGNGCLAESFRSHRNAGVTTLVLNVLETLPYHRVESTILKWKGTEVAKGLLHAIRLLGSVRVYLVLPPGVERQCQDFFSHIRNAVGGITVVTMAPRFPGHRPEALLPALLRTDPRTSVQPLRVGAMMIAPRTCLALHEAVDLAKPLTDAWIHLTGSTMAHSQVVKAKIGTPLYAVIEDCGGLVEMPAAIVLNDPMEGWTTRDVDLPLTKEMHSLLLLGPGETNPMPESDCVHCTQCIVGCPVGIQPELIYKLLRKGKESDARKLGLGDCTGCGFCSYVCPSHIPLVQTFRAEQRRLTPEGGDQ